MHGLSGYVPAKIVQGSALDRGGEKEKVLARVQERIDRGEVVAGGFTGDDIAGRGKVEGETLQSGSGRSLRWAGLDPTTYTHAYKGACWQDRSRRVHTAGIAVAALARERKRRTG